MVFEEPGTYSITTNHPENRVSKTVKIIAAPLADIQEVNTDPYVDGLPTFKFATMQSANKLSWRLNDKKVGNNQEVSMNLFNKGTYSLTLEVEDNNGCRSGLSKEIKIDKGLQLDGI